ncbi:MAG: ABC transporter substrate-binding protein, partial [Acidimicrobiales bacterium]|nr:ABC transporter substrate-binding protein [Acidimicrobiales bacterium]
MRRKAAASAVAVLALATLVAGFGGGPGRAVASAGKGGGGFPVSVSSGGGTVRIASRPSRILSLSASATQMLYAVGAGRQVVGVDKYSTYPRGAPKTQFSGFETDAEDYLPLHPDLVVLAFDPGHLVAQLKDLHIPTLVMPAPSTLTGAYGQIRELALATGHRAGGARSVASVQGLLARTVAAAGSKAHGRSYYIELDPTLYTATSSTFIGALLSRLRMRDVAD